MVMNTYSSVLIIFYLLYNETLVITKEPVYLVERGDFESSVRGSTFHDRKVRNREPSNLLQWPLLQKTVLTKMKVYIVLQAWYQSRCI